MSTPHFELELPQGADWAATVNWYGGGVFRAPIEEIDPGYPTQIRVTAHNLPIVSDTPIIISGVQGAEILNSEDAGIEMCTRVDNDYFTVPISTVACEWIVGTGEITWYRPTDITAYTARCRIRNRWHTTAYILELTTENGGITLNTDDASIQLNITAAETDAINVAKAVFDVELITPGGLKTKVFTGGLTVIKDISR